MRARRLLMLGLAAFGVAALAFHAPDALAQGRNPFSVGISEGGGSAWGLTGWILAQQQHFDLMMRAAVRAVRTDASGFWSLLGLAFAYGVFHAAGPGHGKAVLASYLVANERALKRGLVLAGLAALLQAVVAIALVGVLTIALGATSQGLRASAQWVEIGSYAAIVLVGVGLVWRKGRALVPLLRPVPPAPVAAGVSSRFACSAADEPADGPCMDCGHFHMPAPAALDAGFSWRSAVGTIFAAGLRPCSGAILVLVFASAQGILAAGIAATLAMALGTAVTTGALAASAVYAKGFALRFTDAASPRGLLVARGLEFAAAAAVLLLGLGLLTGTLAGGAL